MGVAALVWLRVTPGPPVQQPLDFDHAKHTPMACVVCHQGAETSTRAGYPADATCVECHNTAPRARGADAVWPKAKNAPRIAWVRVNRVPEHTYFSHRRHVVLANLECASCHAEVGKESMPPSAPATRHDMAACESCHARENANNDCAACHM
jgi:hypothetical protein